MGKQYAYCGCLRPFYKATNLKSSSESNTYLNIALRINSTSNKAGDTHTGIFREVGGKAVGGGDREKNNFPPLRSSPR